ncbi:hypothetical protein EFA69_14640 [Rufibacter immobilis]|uniref:Uncharacterized protein n=1 Tax=Rufibacter immobilis TaxID=1348778 RepID=A0A3M9MPB1_9BACT|nr:hypothetical protein [Rufibacter immobilis]RNI27374.1 hypothetical protein EFA69_14640 [Rufibacter immobilis]
MENLDLQIMADGKGYLDRECPSAECGFKFKVLLADWTGKLKDQEVHCPQCGHTSAYGNWFTTEQVEEIRDRAMQRLASMVRQSLAGAAADFNRRQYNNPFVKMSISVRGPSATFLLPIPAMEEMQQVIARTECATSYAVVGSAFFCPCCGHNSAEETFDNSLANIVGMVRNLSIIKEAVSAVSTDEAENTCRSLLEKGLSDCVVTMQRFCEVTYAGLSNAKKAPFNAFQKLDVGGDLWREVFGTSYSDWLEEHEIERLTVFFQRRHLLQHTEGMVDEKYISKTGDNTYREGQRIVVRENDVLELLGYIKTIKERIVRQL